MNFYPDVKFSFTLALHTINWYNNGGFVDFDILFILALKAIIGYNNVNDTGGETVLVQCFCCAWFNVYFFIGKFLYL